MTSISSEAFLKKEQKVKEWKIIQNKNDNIHKNEVQDIRSNWTFVVQLAI